MTDGTTVQDYRASMEPQGSVRARRNVYLALASVVIAIQFVLVAKAFPLSELSSALPLLHIDHALHWYLIKLGKNLAMTGNVVGYDPFFAAGYVNGIQYNVSARVPTLLAAFLPPATDEVPLYKAYVFGSSVLAPVAVFAAASTLRLAPVEALVAALLGILMWWASYLRWYDTAGMVGYVTVCYVAVLFIALIIRYLEGNGSQWVAVGLGVVGAWFFFWHWALPVPVAVAVLTYLAINARHLNWPRTLTGLAIISVVSVLPNLFWVYASYRYTDSIAPNSTQMVIDASRIGRELVGLLRADAFGSKANPLLFVAALWTCVAREAPQAQRVWRALMLAAVLLQFLAYLGAALPGIGQIQPNRFAAAGYLLLCVPAARGLGMMLRAALERVDPPIRRAFAGAALALLLLVGSVSAWEVWREVSPGPQGRYGAVPPEVRPLGDNSVWLLDWLQRRTSADARVFFETSLARVHDEAHMAGYYAYTSKREFVGGPYPWMHFANSWDGTAFRTPIAEIPTDKMAAYLSLYNIGAIVVHSDAAKKYFDSMPGVKLDAEHGKLRAYLVDGEHSFFLKGTGRVQERGHNHVLITDIRGPELVLKYHNVAGLVTDPPTQLEGIQLLDDPKPFVRIVNPPARLRLYMP